MLKKYELDIYPADVYITSKNDFDSVKNKFKFYRDIEHLNNDEDGTPMISKSSAGTTFLVRRGKHDTHSILIVLDVDAYLSSDSFNTAAHESVHSADIIWDIIGSDTESYTDGNEPYAYLVGWIAGKIGEFMITYGKYIDDERENKH